MALVEVVGCATTREVVPGRERQEQGRVQVSGQQFIDIVECSDPRIAGENRLTLELRFDPKTGEGTVAGPFVLQAELGAAMWQGELRGVLRAGKVSAAGIARGEGALAGSALRLDFQQVDVHPLGKPPCPAPKAFFEIHGLLLDAAEAGQ